MYDKHGMAGLSSMSGEFFDASEIFRSFFSGYFFGGNDGNETEVPVDVTLEEFYSGVVKTVDYERKLLCTDCNG